MRFVRRFMFLWMATAFTLIGAGSWSWAIWASVQYTFLATGNVGLAMAAGLAMIATPIIAVVALASTEDTPDAH